MDIAVSAGLRALPAIVLAGEQHRPATLGCGRVFGGYRVKINPDKWVACGLSLGGQPGPLSEEEAIALFLDDPSDQTFDTPFRLYVPRLIRYFRLRGCNLAIAEELAQEVLLAVYREAPLLRERENFRAWLFKIAHNKLLQAWRTESRRVETVEFRWASSAVDSGRNPLEASILQESIVALKDDEQEILHFRWVDGLEYREIAVILELPLGTVQWKIFQIRRKLAAIVR
jgi:RNA polymerase sigma-70 factor, ECF subfamily